MVPSAVLSDNNVNCYVILSGSATHVDILFSCVPVVSRPSRRSTQQQQQQQQHARTTKNRHPNPRQHSHHITNNNIKMRLVTWVAAAMMASATAVGASPVEKRAVGGVLLCTGPDSTGTCKHKVYPLKDCQQLKPPFHRNISTFAPDGEDFACFPRAYDCGGDCRSPTGCTFGAVDFNYAHKYNLSAIGWGTMVASFDCFLKG
ncbi:hypothetical protein JDV02_000716 [Purpureocillium takamizusanense]|uniref:Uncharacterized protein n=1 Tax=Purpureocillium takamizusanense TaxID=2060973 RepID=A0A9Q8Q7C4_9HYPO|nr:uncharacterized protein JDV02_000716 [Purpureocillium takamizusanense]UNI14036.1 hypothetical protein JDV02_000716 [Purpureocillium takamizusanense]